MRHAAALALAAAATFVACSSSGNNAAPTASPSAGATLSYIGTTNGTPQNCVRRMDDFRYYDALNHTTMPFVQSYTPWPAPLAAATNFNIYYYQTIPTSTPIPGAGPPTPILVEYQPGPLPSGTPVFRAEPIVPAINYAFSFGLHDQATVEVIPAGTLATEFEWDVGYRARQDMDAEQYHAALLAKQYPTPIATNFADSQRDATFQSIGVPAVTAIALGASPDDSPYKGYYLLGTLMNKCCGTPVQSANPHPRIATCNWLQWRKYDLIVTIVHRETLPPNDYATLAANLNSQQVPNGPSYPPEQNITANEQWVAVKKDTYVVSGVTPQTWFPPMAQQIQLGDPTDVLKFASGSPPFPYNSPIAEIILPTNQPSTPGPPSQ